ncbi:efflux RND transporter permease subunit [Rhodobacteraceae bacterium B1Z28]|uniref:Efflux RND transporter permease subunit n=1 Tax=Ruegeria haliotis TaxID=2747601 RepID=A0ABX2PSL6_9RHOB|nr:efflux RND transporter permease subunit [Ruegeria haliotis]NVO56729.1 efflux RND transporter permease subunit [Ruegeria haliotis]
MDDFGKGIASVAVRRPYLAAVLNLLLVIGGLAALVALEVREMPNVDQPVLMLRAELAGASPETVDAELTAPLESATARVSGVTNIEAASEEGETRIRVEFDTGVDIDAAASDLREAASRVQRSLPDAVEQLTVTKSDPDARAIIQIAVLPDQFDYLTLGDRIENDIVPYFYAVPGVASVDTYGVRGLQMRVVFDPLQLSRYNIQVSDIADALEDASYDIPVGSYTSKVQQLLVRVDASAVTADMIEDIVIRDDIRIGNVAEAYFAPEDASNFVRLNGEPAIGLGIVRQANSNTMDISNRVRDIVSRLEAQHEDLSFVTISNKAVFIESATAEVLRTLGLTTLVVILSILLFFRKLQATLVPALVIPTALIGSFTAFWLFGFSVNLITLLALVLATGLIVDDAIVVLENIQRRQVLGEDRQTAAIRGTKQVFFAVIATTAVLVAVFIPISFLPSATGRLFREFGVVLAAAVVLSSFAALTLVPALGARMSLSDRTSRSGWLDRFGARIVQAYVAMVRRVIAAPALVVLLSLGFAGAVIYHLPLLNVELTPAEDRGEFETFAMGPDGVGVEYMQGQADEVDAAILPLLEQGDVRALYSVVGQWDINRVISKVALAPWDERERSQAEIIAEVKDHLAGIAGSRMRARGRGSLDTGPGSSGSGLEFFLTGGNYADIYNASLLLSEAMEAGPFSNVDISYNPTQPQLSIGIDRQSVASLDVSLTELSETLKVMVGGAELVDLNVDGRAVPVVLSAPTGLIQDVSDLRGINIRSSTGNSVPLSGLTTVTQVGVAAELNRTAQRRAIEMSADIGDLTLGAGLSEFEAIAETVLPSGIGYVLSGTANTFQETNRDLIMTYGFAIVIVFLVLVAQFESLTSPLVVMAVIPFGLCATLAAMILSGATLSLFSQIGLVLLIGLMAKNGVLLVEFADQAQHEGQNRHDAIVNAAKTRLRPISMTLISTMIGSLPLILSTGAGAEARAAIGWAIFSGLGLSSLFALFLTPALYVLITGTRTQEALPQTSQ